MAGKQLKTRIKEALYEELKKMNVDGVHFYNLIDDYMALWHIKNALIDDIEKRGVSIYWQNGESQFGYKKNDSVSELHKTNAQMLKILQELNIKTTEVEIDDDEDEL